MEVINKDASILFEENISIGQNLHIISGAEMVIGKNTTISANVFITNVDHEFRQIEKHILNQPLLIKETRIGENCFIGYGAVIQAGTTLGKQCIVGANAVVRGNFPDFTVIAGVPARIIKRYDFTSQTWKKTDTKGNFIDEI
ncbi:MULTISPECIES: acyltransferase [unclassified Sulfuricurvum]|uniref:acyltransferase n=1 Tax=unclassified Sulfuricurvum TaxID=2632390 RepID=UPI000325AF5D|nr:MULTISPECIES: acyltransferase [unclassified Sulfuricurvum]